MEFHEPSSWLLVSEDAGFRMATSETLSHSMALSDILSVKRLNDSSPNKKGLIPWLGFISGGGPPPWLV